MDYPDNIAELERELRRVVEIVERDEEAVGRSKRPKVESIFLASSTKLRNDIQRRLRTAMAERAPILEWQTLTSPGMTMCTTRRVTAHPDRKCKRRPKNRTSFRARRDHEQPPNGYSVRPRRCDRWT